MAVAEIDTTSVACPVPPRMRLLVCLLMCPEAITFLDICCSRNQHIIAACHCIDGMRGDRELLDIVRTIV